MAALLSLIAAIALVLLAAYVEEAVFHTVTIESFFNKTPLGPPLRNLCHAIVRLFPFISPR